MMQRLLMLAALAALAVACASSSENDDNDSGSDATFRDTTDVEPDTQPDTTPEDTNPVDTTPLDTAPPDTRPADCEVVGDECTPSAVYCVDGEDAVGFCSRCGLVLRTDACDLMEVCEVTDGAGRCRPCEGDECPVLDACEANERTCRDFNTVEICGPDGRIDNVADCAAGRRCFDGSCGNAGGTTGDTCTQDVDPTAGCAGHSCICGEEFRTLDGMSSYCAGTPGLGAGYCSTSGCDENGCNYDTETCADFGLSGTVAGGRYCVASEGCDRRGSSCGDHAGFRCNELPGRRAPDGPVQWDWGCWAPVSTIGDPCSSDADCLGGTCRVQSVGGANVSYCTMPCGAEASCPSHAACVEDPDGPGHVCLAYPTTVACPRVDTEPLNIAPTAPIPRYGAGQTSVCYFAR